MKLQSGSNRNKTDNNPFVTVLIPVFNGAIHLKETVSSIYKSTYRNFEIILVDDGSTDASKALCKKLTKRYAKVRFYSFERNKGLGRVLNFGLKKAHGEFICRINQDDIMLPNRIQTQVRFLQTHTDIVAVGSSITIFNDTGSIETIYFPEKDTEIKKIWLMLSPFSDPSVMYRKSAVVKAGGYDQKYWPADDVHLWYRLGLTGKLANLKKPLVKVRWHNQAASIKFFRINAHKTFQVHMWADQYVQKAPLYVHIFWICQFIAGLTFSPEFNWNTYRVLKKVIRKMQSGYLRFRSIFQNTIQEKTVPNHPKKLNLSGV